MKLKLSLVLMVLAISATSAFGWGAFQDVAVGVGTGMSGDGLAISYNSAGISYISSVAYGSIAINTSFPGNSVGIANAAGQYMVAWNGTGKAYVWKGTLDGAGAITGDPYSGTYLYYARGIAGDATQAYVAGSETMSGKSGVAARWKAPSGSVATYGQPSNFSSDLYYLYSASNNGNYAGWGRLSSSGTVANKSQAMVLEAGALVSLRNAWGAPSIDYYSNAYIAPDGQTCFGYTGASDNSTALACFWNRGTAFTTNTTCNLIPLLSGYQKSYAMKSDNNAALIAGWTIKAAGEWGIDRRTIFLYDKATNTTSDLRAVLAANGVDMSGWGLMDITGIANNGTLLSGTMLAADDTYWTTGTVSGSYHTWVADLTQTVPEPGSMLALASGLIGLVGFGIRRRK